MFTRTVRDADGARVAGTSTPNGDTRQIGFRRVLSTPVDVIDDVLPLGECIVVKKVNNRYKKIVSIRCLDVLLPPTEGNGLVPLFRLLLECNTRDTLDRR